MADHVHGRLRLFENDVAEERRRLFAGRASRHHVHEHDLVGDGPEALDLADLFKRAFHTGTEPRLAFWRDHRGNEIDLVVGAPAGPVPVELKSGATVASSFFKGLRYWQKIAPNPQRGVLVHGGDESYVREGTAVLSWRHCW